MASGAGIWSLSPISARCKKAALFSASAPAHQACSDTVLFFPPGSIQSTFPDHIGYRESSLLSSMKILFSLTESSSSSALVLQQRFECGLRKKLKPYLSTAGFAT